MAFHGQPKTAELTQYDGAVRLVGRAYRAGVGVDVVHVANAIIGEAACAIHEARCILIPREFRQAFGVVLSPTLVEDGPHDDARVVAYGVDDSRPFPLELISRLRVAIITEFRAMDARQITGDHVLPHENAEGVGPIEKARWLQFAVLTDHVEAELLGDFYIVDERLIRRRRVQPSRPPALVQRPELKENLVVEAEPLHAVLVIA